MHALTLSHLVCIEWLSYMFHIQALTSSTPATHLPAFSCPVGLSSWWGHQADVVVQPTRHSSNFLLHKYLWLTEHSLRHFFLVLIAEVSPLVATCCWITVRLINSATFSRKRNKRRRKKKKKHEQKHVEGVNEEQLQQKSLISSMCKVSQTEQFTVNKRVLHLPQHQFQCFFCIL